MSDMAYRLLGLVVWRALKASLRELLPSPRRTIVTGVATLAAAGLAAGLLRRAAG